MMETTMMRERAAERRREYRRRYYQENERPDKGPPTAMDGHVRRMADVLSKNRDGMTYADLAAVLHMSEESAMRVMKVLRKQLQNTPFRVWSWQEGQCRKYHYRIERKENA